MRDAFIGFRAPSELKARLQTLADQHERTLSQMATILLKEALNQRECRPASRQQQTAQEFMASLDARIERKRQGEIE